MATKQRSKTNRKAVKRQPFHSHVASSLTATAEHKHSGKRIHSKHTSHGFLLIMLLITGVLLFSNLGALKAFGVSQAGSLNVSANVLGTPPSEGALITFPITNTETSSPLLEVSGTCPAQTLVSIYNNGTFAGSAVCSTDDVFAITITLMPGNNILQAQNYDGLNQPGPATPQHLIVYKPIPTQNQPAVINKTNSLASVVNPVTPQPQAPQPTKSPCYENLEKRSSASISSTAPIISIGCIHRNIFPGEELTLLYSVNGGSAPYAVNIVWNDGNDNLQSILNSDIQRLKHTYSKPGTYAVTLYTTDAKGNKSQIQSVVIVNGDPAAGSGSTSTIINDIKQLWVEAPVPLYIAAVLLALGFWIGDVFQRFSASQSLRKSKKRHA